MVADTAKLSEILQGTGTWLWHSCGTCIPLWVVKEDLELRLPTPQRRPNGQRRRRHLAGPRAQLSTCMSSSLSFGVVCHLSMKHAYRSTRSGRSRHRYQNEVPLPCWDTTRRTFHAVFRRREQRLQHGEKTKMVRFPRRRAFMQRHCFESENTPSMNIQLECVRIQRSVSTMKCACATVSGKKQREHATAPMTVASI